MNALRIISALGMCAIVSHGTASAQVVSGPDIRGIRPVVMLLVDTSASMEYMPTATAKTSECGDECLPVCNGLSSERNRWALTVEALTGSFPEFECVQENRNGAAYLTRFDYNFYMPHHRLVTAGKLQLANGILDSYMDRIKFGLMTFDGIQTIRSRPTLVADSEWTSTFEQLSDGEDGMYSYGPSKLLTFPNCPTAYRVNSGVRNEAASEGGLVSVGDDWTTDHRTINQIVQQRLMAARPYGGTPIAGMLDDAKIYFRTHTDVADKNVVLGGDRYYHCRDRYAILLTDGYPDSDFRDSRFDCQASGGCPYDTAENLAAELCQQSGGTCTGSLKGLFVVGFAVDATKRAALNNIAQLGGTPEAYFAETQDQLVQRLSAVLDQTTTNTTTRTSPAFASRAGSGTQAQLQFNTGFNVLGGGKPWTGVLERTRYVCDPGTLQPVAQRDSSATGGDNFSAALNQRVVDVAPRNLLTVVPTVRANTKGWLRGFNTYSGISSPGIGGGMVAAESSLAPSAFSSTAGSLSATANAMYTTPIDARRIIDWIHGTGTSDRCAVTLPGGGCPRTGAILHSSPTIMGPAPQDLADESYNLYRQTGQITNRPQVLFVGTNDGVLHAFAADACASPNCSRDVAAGEELWGFIPPALLPELRSATLAPQVTMDGTPVIKEVILQKDPGQQGSVGVNRYRTILITGIRGTPGYFALDVTDPINNPQFLWQYSDPEMGQALAPPTMVQMLINTTSGPQIRAVAILQGGLGALDDSLRGSSCLRPHQIQNTPRNEDSTETYSPRTSTRCWTTKGRRLVFIDVATGEMLKTFTSADIDAPLLGGISAYNGNVGEVATRAFVTDQDGYMLRVNFSSPNPADWTIQPFYDMFWGVANGWNLGQPALQPPVISVDEDGRPVIIQGTGDVDRLDGTAANRIVSLTEEITFTGVGAETSFDTIVNWDVRLEQGEQLTGAIEMFDNKVYFSTFQSLGPTNDACNSGAAKIWGVEYVDGIPGSGCPLGGDCPLVPKPGIKDDGGTFVQFLPPMDNTLVMGVGVAQRPNCFEGVSETDPYAGGTRYRVSRHGGGEFQLVAQVSGQGTGSLGTSITNFQRQLDTPPSLTRAQSWGGSVD